MSASFSKNVTKRYVSFHNPYAESLGHSTDNVTYYTDGAYFFAEGSVQEFVLARNGTIVSNSLATLPTEQSVYDFMFSIHDNASNTMNTGEVLTDMGKSITVTTSASDVTATFTLMKRESHPVKQMVYVLTDCTLDLYRLNGDPALYGNGYGYGAVYVARTGV
jgi:hypothetical protein